MKIKLIIIVAIVVSIGFVTTNNTEATTPSRWVITENSTLQVTGSTNVNKFTCEIVGYNSPDTINVTDLNQLVRLTGSINLDISKFNCHNQMMTKQLRRTLKAKEYPTLCIDFISLSEMPKFGATPDILNGVVEIHLAGKSKRYVINYVLSTSQNKIFCLNGYREINFSDFNLKAPKKVGGVITAKDKLIVQFNLNLKSI